MNRLIFLSPQRHYHLRERKGYVCEGACTKSGDEKTECIMREAFLRKGCRNDLRNITTAEKHWRWFWLRRTDGLWRKSALGSRIVWLNHLVLNNHGWKKAVQQFFTPLLSTTSQDVVNKKERSEASRDGWFPGTNLKGCFGIFEGGGVYEILVNTQIQWVYKLLKMSEGGTAQECMYGSCCM